MQDQYQTQQLGFGQLNYWSVFSENDFIISSGNINTSDAIRNGDSSCSIASQDGAD
jgi:hypothetical protein